MESSYLSTTWATELDKLRLQKALKTLQTMKEKVEA